MTRQPDRGRKVGLGKGRGFGIRARGEGGAEELLVAVVVRILCSSSCFRSGLGWGPKLCQVDPSQSDYQELCLGMKQSTWKLSPGHKLSLTSGSTLLISTNMKNSAPSVFDALEKYGKEGV